MVPSEQSGSPVIPLSRFRAAVSRPRGKKLAAAILESRDPAAQVAALPATELYLLLRELGLADAGEIFALATPEQVRGVIDLDAWNRDQIETTKLMPWIAALIEGGYERVTDVWSGLDQELRALILARETRIFDLSLGEDPDDEPASDELPVIRTPDTFFAVRIMSEDHAVQTTVARLIDFLYRGDMELARHTLMAARSELLAELEEMSYRWRSGRLADLGYVDYYDALSIYELLDPEAITIGENTASVSRGPGARLPVSLADAIFGRAFLARALDHITDAAEAQRLEMALVVLVNHVLAADRAQPGDADALALAAERATATLALGLETISRGDLEAAADALRTVALSRIFRAGHTLGIRLAHLATPLSLRALALDDPAPAIISALINTARPRYAATLDDPPAQEDRAFASVKDLARAAWAVADIAGRIALAEAIGIDVAALAREKTPAHSADALVRTAALSAASSRALSPEPIGVADLQKMLPKVRHGKALTEAARRAATEALTAAADEAGASKIVPDIAATIASVVNAVEGAIADLDPDAIDPRFVAADLAIRSA